LEKEFLQGSKENKPLSPYLNLEERNFGGGEKKTLAKKLKRKLHGEKPSGKKKEFWSINCPHVERQGRR